MKTSKKEIIIDYDHFSMIIDAVDFKRAALDKLEREIFNCMDREYKGMVVANNLRSYYYKLEAAKKMIYRLFESQHIKNKE